MRPCRSRAALLTSMMESGNACRDFARAVFYGVIVGEVYVNAGGAASGGVDLVYSLICHGCVQVGDEDMGAFGCEALGGGASDS